MDSCRLKWNVSTPYPERTMALTGYLGRLDISEGNAVSDDIVPVDVAPGEMERQYPWVEPSS